MSVESLGSAEVVLLTLEVVHPCTGNRSCSPYKTDMVGLRHTSASGFDSGCMLAWREPACAVLADRLNLRTDPYRDLARTRLGHTGL
jgi:hypothetical protein